MTLKAVIVSGRNCPEGDQVSLLKTGVEIRNESILEDRCSINVARNYVRYEAKNIIF